MPVPEEWDAFIGVKSAHYRGKFGKFILTGAGKFEFGWNWPAFFAGFWWYLYRKMYAWAVVDLAVSCAFGWTIFVPLLWAATRAVTGDYLYFRLASGKIRDARGLLPPGASASDPSHLALLSRLGGVHRWIVVVGIVVTALFLVAGLALGLFSAWIHYFGIPWQKGPGRWA